MESLKRLEVTLHATDDTLYCGALDSTWPLSLYRAGSITTVVADTRLKLPIKAKIDERSKEWSFPEVTVQFEPAVAMELMVNNLEKDEIVTRLSYPAVDHRQ
ncbi:hypothetical protein FOZ61_004356, partial [Perkinsus olseni]